MTALTLYAILIALCQVQGQLTVYLTDAPVQRIGPRLYKKELLTSQYRDPIELAYDSATRNLFFMYMDEALQNSGRAYVNVVTKRSAKVDGIRENKATAVDPEAGVVYFGSRDGLYVYDPVENRARNVGLYNVDVFKLVVRDNRMYLIDANDHMIYKVSGANAVRLGKAKTVIDFEIDGKGNVHFATICGVYCAVGGDEIVKNSDLSVSYIFIVDGERTYSIAEGALYELDCAKGAAAKIADLDFSPRSLVFGDYGDIYYSEGDNIYRLKPITSYVMYKLHKKKRV
ncbi:unnamed protein product, partial [Iphiclides podalirius]